MSKDVLSHVFDPSIHQCRSNAVNLVAPRTARGPSPVRVKRPSERKSLSRSATRALDLLEYFGESRRPLRAIEISKMLGIHPSTTNQLLKTMVDSAHLVFEAQTKMYLPSPRLAGFSGWILATYGADEKLRGLVRDVQSRTGLIVTLTTPNDLFMQILDLATPQDHQTERGLRVSVFGSAIGSAYLSTLENSEIARLAERARIPKDEMEKSFQTVLEIRRDGYADGPSADNSIWSIAVPLPPGGTPIPMVLGVAGPSAQVQRDRDTLRTCLRHAVTHWPASGQPDR